MIEQLLASIIKFQDTARGTAKDPLVLHLTAKDEQALAIELWKKDLTAPVPNLRQVLQTLGGYPIVWGAPKTALRPKDAKVPAKAPAAPAASAAPKAAVAKPKAAAKVPSPVSPLKKTK